MSKVGLVVAAVLGIAGLVIGGSMSASHEGPHWISGLQSAQTVLTLTLLVAAVAAALAMLRGGDGVWAAVMTAAVLVLCVVVLQGVGGWAAPLALAACVVAPLFERRRSAGADAPPPSA